MDLGILYNLICFIQSSYVNDRLNDFIKLCHLVNSYINVLYKSLKCFEEDCSENIAPYFHSRLGNIICLV